MIGFSSTAVRYGQLSMLFKDAAKGKKHALAIMADLSWDRNSEEKAPLQLLQKAVKAKLESYLLQQARAGSRGGVKAALKYGVNIDAQNENGMTAAHFAATDDPETNRHQGDLALLMFLHTRGADLTIKNADKKTPVDLAVGIGIKNYLHKVAGFDI